MEELNQRVPDNAVDRLVQAREEYDDEVSPAYDDALQVIFDRATSQRCLGKADIGSVVLWKRLNASSRWAKALMVTPDEDVRAATGTALACVTDTSCSIAEGAVNGRRALSAIPAFDRGDALASAVLFVAAPTRMAVYDRRAQSGIEKLGLTLSAQRGRYGRYMGLVEQLADAARRAGLQWLPRDVDIALYSLGRATGSSKP
ncbi:MAG TPA: hypothetical protein VG502_16195 [Flexivirga sp.]|uniref:hypothetical protein n=1 Tax=Flexivirga sp. TaxID=1962927 RepID=UPI002BE2D405|nr:hypothetical protein [Flexivirga sp.]HWC23837.1 hypothetical protein [Flexivirga sp.]